MLKVLVLAVFVTLTSAGFAAENQPVAAMAEGVQKAEIAGGSYYFKPDHITVKAGIPVELTIRSESVMVPHNFILKAPEAGIDISETLTRAPKVIRFTPTKPGRYDFYCDRRFMFSKSHKEKGMKGTLEVTE